MKILKAATTHQSLVTILDGKLRALSGTEGVDMITLASPNDGDPRSPAGRFVAMPIARSIAPIRDFVAVIRLARLLRRERVEVLHTHTAKAGFIGSAAGWLARTPLVCHTYHGLPFYEGQGALKNTLYKCLEIAAALGRDILFSQNQTDVETLKKTPYIRKKRIVFEGNGVDAVSIERSAGNQAPAVAGLFKGPGLKLLCIARLEPVKRLEKVVEAVKWVSQKGIAVECVVAGKGPLALPETVKTLYTPAIHALIAKCDLVILTSEKEGVPRGLMEAMALKKPVLATDVPGTRELVVNGETGILVPFNDQAALNQALLRLAGDAALRARLGEAGCRRVEAQFTERRAVGLWLRHYLTPDDFSAMARLHILGIPQGFLSSLGEEFLARLYRAISRDSESCVFVERDGKGRMLGFVAGTLSTRRCFRSVVLSNLFSLGLPLIPKLISYRRIKNMLQTLRYGVQKNSQSVQAELLAIAVDEKAVGQGKGKRLVEALEGFFREGGLNGPYKVVTAAADPRSNGFYKKSGFEFVRDFTHHGIAMNEYRKSIKPE